VFFAVVEFEGLFGEVGFELFADGLDSLLGEQDLFAFFITF
jgi:hypothetical protein